MTLEQLLDCDAAKLEAMSDKELLAYFEPFLKVCRPELAERPSEKKKPSAPQVYISDHKKAALAALGVDVGEMLKFKKRK